LYCEKGKQVRNRFSLIEKFQMHFQNFGVVLQKFRSTKRFFGAFAKIQNLKIKSGCGLEKIQRHKKKNRNRLEILQSV